MKDDERIGNNREIAKRVLEQCISEEALIGWITNALNAKDDRIDFLLRKLDEAATEIDHLRQANTLNIEAARLLGEAVKNYKEENRRLRAALESIAEGKIHFPDYDWTDWNGLDAQAEAVKLISQFAKLALAHEGKGKNV